MNIVGSSIRKVKVFPKTIFKTKIAPPFHIFKVKLGACELQMFLVFAKIPDMIV